MVPTAVLAGARGALPRRSRGIAAASDPVPEFRRVAARLAANDRCRGAARLLVLATHRHGRAAAANRPAAARDEERARRAARIHAVAKSGHAPQVAEPRPERHAVHDAAGGISVPPQALHGPRRCRGGVADRQSQPDRNRAPHRNVRQHDRPADRSCGRPEVQRGPAARPPDHVGCLSKPGHADRGDFQGVARAAQPRSERPASRDVHSAERGAESAGAPGTVRAVRRRRSRDRAVRPRARDRRRRRRARWLVRI